MMDMAQLRYGLNEVVDAARANPRLISKRQVKGLLRAVSEEGFRVGSALGFLARREEFEDIVERLRADKDVRRWMRADSAHSTPIWVDPRLVARSLAVHSHGWRMAGREETLDSAGLRH